MAGRRREERIGAHARIGFDGLDAVFVVCKYRFFWPPPLSMSIASSPRLCKDGRRKLMRKKVE